MAGPCFEMCSRVQAGKGGMGYAVEKGWVKARRWGVGAGIRAHACTCRIEELLRQLLGQPRLHAGDLDGQARLRPLQHGFWTSFYGTILGGIGVWVVSLCGGGSAPAPRAV